MDSFGETIRKLRAETKLPLRTLAAFLDLDQAILSKIERGQRNATREQVVSLAKYFNIKESDLLVSWLSDKLVYALAEEEVGFEALQVAEEKVSYQKQSKEAIGELISKIKSVLKKDGRVATAWLYGSTISKEAKLMSDVDIIIEFNEKKRYSMFDLLDIAHLIETKINRKVDLVEKGQLKNFAMKTATQNLKKIYG
jgi:predicted nucleotidyltransferase/DNA-binding XRE family transcriptional regulator